MMRFVCKMVLVGSVLAVFVSVVGVRSARAATDVELQAGIPAKVAIVVGKGSGNYFARMEALRGLGRSLSDEEVSVLCEFLHRTPREDPLSADKLNALKNEVVNVLKKQRGNPDELIQHLVELHQDTSQHPVWRDYCIQHLGTFYPAVEGGQKKAVTDVLWTATDEKKGGMAGTALIALTNNKNDPALDAREIADKAFAIAQDATYSQAARITAIQICAKLDDIRVLPLARALADGSGPIPLRTSALGAIGLKGNEADLERLERYAESSDIRLRRAGTVALLRVKGRSR